jgi:hypothetical protein
MRSASSIMMMIVMISILGIDQIKEDKQGDVQCTYKKNVVRRCPENSDALYDRKQVLKQLAKILNRSVPEYRHVSSRGFYVGDERGGKFFVHDLTDPSNKDTSLKDCIDFKNHHIYHFAPIAHHFSLSHIVILEDGKLKVFRSINCKDRGDKLEDVIGYLNQKLMNDKDKDEILDRVRNYRKYGIYVKIDDSSLVCEEVGSSEE